MTTRRAASLLTLVLGLTATLTGCIEDKQTVTVEPDGKGTLRVERTLGKQMSEMLLSVAGAGDKLAAVRGVAAQQLSQSARMTRSVHCFTCGVGHDTPVTASRPADAALASEKAG